MSSFWREKKEGLVSLFALVVVLLVLVALLLGPVVHHAERYRSELRRDARILQELRAVEAVQGEIVEAQRSYHERGLESWVYSGNLSEIGLDVQRRVSGWLAGAQVQRITPVNTRVAEAYQGVGVQAQFVSSMEELVEIIRQIEASRPLLLIERLQISPVAQRRTRNQPEPPQRVTVQMTVQTYVLTGVGT